MGLGSIISGIVGRSKKYNLPNTPEYYTDENYSDLQDFLKNYSKNLLQGDIPDYYAAIGQPASSGVLGDYVADSTKDIINQDLEAGALTGRGRTGLSSNALTAAGNLSGTLRYNDYLRAMQGRESLLNTGLSSAQDVRNSAFSNMGDRNAYNQWKYGADLNSEVMRNTMANKKRQELGNIWGDVVDTGISGLTAGMGGGSTSAGLSSILNSFSGGKSSAYNYNQPSNVPTYGSLSTSGSGSSSQLMQLLAKILPAIAGA